MKRDTFYLHSALPPVELKDRLDLEVRVQNNLHEKECKIVLKWRDEGRFTVYMVSYEHSSGVYRSAGAGHGRISLGGGFGESRSASYSPVYCGQIAPDGEGSVISGHFRQLLWAWFICVLIFGGGFLACAVEKEYLVYLVVLVLGMPMLQSCLAPERTESAGELWDALEFLVGTVDSLAAEQDTLEEHNQDKE